MCGSSAWKAAGCLLGTYSFAPPPFDGFAFFASVLHIVFRHSTYPYCVLQDPFFRYLSDFSAYRGPIHQAAAQGSINEDSQSSRPHT